MRIGFSSAGCPQWDLERIVAQATAMGYEAVELDGLQGEAYLPGCPALTSDPAAVAARFRDANVELVCLGTDNTLHWADRPTLDRHLAQVRETIELASRLACPFVRVAGGTTPNQGNRNRVVMRIVEALRELAPIAARHRVTLLLENQGSFSGSRDVWYILDAVGHPAVRCCWDLATGHLAGESASLSIPRLSSRIAVAHLVDTTLKPDGTLAGFAVPGAGQLPLERWLALLAGVASEPYLIVDWPKRRHPALAEPEEALPAALAWVKGTLERFATAAELSAYKGDKNAPRFASPAASRAARAQPA